MKFNRNTFWNVNELFKMIAKVWIHTVEIRVTMKCEIRCSSEFNDVVLFLEIRDNSLVLIFEFNLRANFHNFKS